MGHICLWAVVYQNLLSKYNNTSFIVSNNMDIAILNFYGDSRLMQINTLILQNQDF